MGDIEVFITEAPIEVVISGAPGPAGPAGGAGGFPPSNDISMGGFKITSLGNAVASTDAMNKQSVASDTTAAISTHSGASDPHGDRAWATGQFLPKAAVMPEGIPNINTATATYFMTPGFGVTTTTAALQNGQVWFSALMLQRDATLSEIMVHVNTLTASGTLRLGLADSNSDGLPGTWLADFGTVNPSTTGVKTISLSQALLSAKLYWLGVVAQGTANNCVLNGRSGWDPRVPIELPGTTPTTLATSRNAPRTATAAFGGALSGAITLTDITTSGPCYGVKLL